MDGSKTTLFFSFNVTCKANKTDNLQQQAIAEKCKNIQQATFISTYKSISSSSNGRIINFSWNSATTSNNPGLNVRRERQK